MPKVSKLPAGRKGSAKQDDDATGVVDPTDQFGDAEADDPALPLLPPIIPPAGITKRPSALDAPEKGADRKKDGADPQIIGGNLALSLGFGPTKMDASASAIVDEVDTKISPARKTGHLLNANPPASLANDFRGGQESWNAMLYQLLLYKAQRGDLNIPHNDTSYRLLYNWVQTQRKHYKLYQENKTSSTFLNADRIAVLDAVDFQWNVRGDMFWQKNFDALIMYKNEHGDVRVPRLYTKNPKLGEWVTDQRRQWKSKMEGKPNMMTDERKSKLDEMGFVWKVRDRADWNDRYEQLLEFKKENGHCIVPQHYTRNRALGKWVAKQREQYRFYREGKHSFLTEERIDLLKSVGFVWQIKGRGVKKNLAGKVPPMAQGMLNDNGKGKSLAKLEEEEKEKEAKRGAAAMAIAMAPAEGMKLKTSPPPLGMAANPLGASLGVGMKTETISLPKSDVGDRNPASVPPISQQQLLQANMAAIAAHASSNQKMVADLAAAFRFGGGNPNVVPGLGDPRAVAALRAQLDGDRSKGQRSFSSML